MDLASTIPTWSGFIKIYTRFEQVIFYIRLLILSHKKLQNRDNHKSSFDNQQFASIFDRCTSLIRHRIALGVYCLDTKHD